MKTGTNRQLGVTKHNSTLVASGVSKAQGRTIKRLKALPLLLGLLCATTGMVNAQSAGDNAAMPTQSMTTPMTREEVKRDRDEFIRTHRWDEEASDWVPKDGKAPATSMKSRAQVKTERNEFLRNNKYDMNNDAWMALKGPRSMSTMSRDDVKSETREFLRTHRWDDKASKWVEYRSDMKK